jgi:hypothetical protein
MDAFLVVVELCILALLVVTPIVLILWVWTLDPMTGKIAVSMALAAISLAVIVRVAE